VTSKNNGKSKPDLRNAKLQVQIFSKIFEKNRKKSKKIESYKFKKFRKNSKKFKNSKNFKKFQKFPNFFEKGQRPNVPLIRRVEIDCGLLAADSCQGFSVVRVLRPNVLPHCVQDGCADEAVFDGAGEQEWGRGAHELAHDRVPVRASTQNVRDKRFWLG
jgi:hypothetical protein